jgi:hypothetical protein
MICPACTSSRVFHSRARSVRDRILKRVLPITFYRCHDCRWRSARLVRSWKSIAAYFLSLIGYAATLGLALGLLAGILFLTLTFMGIPMPWMH